MAEANFDEFVTDPAHSGAGLVGRLINFTGAALSLALLVGVVVWGYRIAVRDATGVPVIQAMQGPMRVAPEDPGGVVAAHLGLAVNRVAGEGTAAPPAERVILAPRPIDLSDEDRPGLGVPVPQPVAAAPVLELPPVAVLPAPVPVDVPAARAEQPRALTPEDAAAAAARALAEALVAGAAGAAAAADDATAADAAGTPGGLARSPRPMPRPVRDAAAIASVEPAMAVAGAEVDPASLRAGARLAQIGAFDDVEAARAEWQRIAERYPSIMAGKARVVQKATSGGRDFWRLRVAGFDTEDDSRRFCAAIESRELRCIPVTHR